MIARTWRGRVRRHDADAYVEYLRETGVAFYRSQRGNAGVLVLRRDETDEAEILFLSLWDSADAIPVPDQRHPERARYFPEDARFLLAMQPLAPHFAVVVDERRTA